MSLDDAQRDLAFPIALCIALAAVLFYVPALNGEFVWDDQFYVTGNFHIHRLDGETLRWAFSESYVGNWHPLTWLSHAVDVAVFGLRPRGHHAVNLVLHAANSALLLLALFRLTRGLWGSAAVAALFALHPIHVESVAWISERKDVLSTLFFLLALQAYVSYVRRQRFGAYALLLLAYAAGLASKPMVITLPLVLLLLDYWPLQRLGRRALLEKIPLFVMAAVSALITLVAGAAAMTSPGVIGPGMRLGNALISYARYLLHILLPFGLSPYYPYLETAPPRWALPAATVVLLLITIAAFALRGKRPYLIVGWLWFLVTLLPVIGIVQVGRQALADRYAYIPSIGLFVAMVWLLRDWVGPQELGAPGPLLQRWRALSRAAKLSAMAVLGVSLALGLATSRQALIWRDGEALWRHALKTAPRSAVVHFNLGNALSMRGALEEAVQEFTLAMESDSAAQHAGPRHRIGLIRRAQGRLEDSLRELDEAVRLQADNAVFRGARANTLFVMGRVDEAEQEYLRALAQTAEPPDAAAIHRNYAVLLLSKQRIDNAIEHSSRAVSLAPTAANYEALAFAYAQAGRLDDAISTLRSGLRANPGDVELAGRLRQLELRQSPGP